MGGNLPGRGLLFSDAFAEMEFRADRNCLQFTISGRSSGLNTSGKGEKAGGLIWFLPAIRTETIVIRVIENAGGMLPVGTIVSTSAKKVIGAESGILALSIVMGVPAE